MIKLDDMMNHHSLNLLSEGIRRHGAVASVELQTQGSIQMQQGSRDIRYTVPAPVLTFPVTSIWKCPRR
jgi:hypothetical protein